MARVHGSCDGRHEQRHEKSLTDARSEGERATVAQRGRIPAQQRKKAHVRSIEWSFCASFEPGCRGSAKRKTPPAAGSVNNSCGRCLCDSQSLLGRSTLQTSAAVIF